MTDIDEFNCVYCEKRYKKRGWLASHIAKKHDDTYLLEKDMTTMRDYAHDLSQEEAANNLSENPMWQPDDLNNTLAPTSTPRVAGPVPRVAAPVPLCNKASNYVNEMGKSLPASFLATLLPAPGFLTNLEESLQEEQISTDLLNRFDEDIRCYKCEDCGFTFLGISNLKKHTENTHRPNFQHSMPDPALPSLGDYLSSLEEKIEHCTDLISKQSALLGKLLNIQVSKSQALSPTKVASSDKLPPVIEIEDDPRNIFECDYCQFKTDHKSQLNLHISGRHSETTPLVCCPICDYKNTSEPEVTKHVQDHHPDTQPYKCDNCESEFNSKTSFNKHKVEKHKKTAQAIDCPFCNYRNNSELTVTKHIEDKHKETISCNKCHMEFSSIPNLKAHKVAIHEPKTGDVIDVENTESEGTAKTKWCLLVGDSHTKSVKTRRIERKLLGNRLRNPAQSSPRAGSAYTTTPNWPGALYPDSNLAERVPKLLNERPYNSMIVLTPSNNIKNVEHLDTNKQNELAVKTALETVATVEKALKDSTTLKAAVIVELPPRADSQRLAGLTEFSNFTLRAAVEKSALRSQITLASLDTLYNYTEQDIFGSPSSPFYDGIHMRGRHGGQAYTNCIVTAVAAAGLSKNRITTPDISTSNRYEALSN